MAVYLVIDIKVIDREVYSRYNERVRPIMEKYGGRYLSRGGKVIPLSGSWNPERIILIEFASYEDVYRCFGSDEYKEIAPLRERSTVGRAIVVEGEADTERDRQEQRSMGETVWCDE